MKLTATDIDGGGREGSDTNDSQTRTNNVAKFNASVVADFSLRETATIDVPLGEGPKSPATETILSSSFPYELGRNRKERRERCARFASNWTVPKYPRLRLVNVRVPHARRAVTIQSSRRLSIGLSLSGRSVAREVGTQKTNSWRNTQHRWGGGEITCVPLRSGKTNRRCKQKEPVNLQTTDQVTLESTACQHRRCSSRAAMRQ